MDETVLLPNVAVGVPGVVDEIVRIVPELFARTAEVHPPRDRAAAPGLGVGSERRLARPAPTHSCPSGRARTRPAHTDRAVVEKSEKNRSTKHAQTKIEGTGGTAAAER